MNNGVASPGAAGNNSWLVYLLIIVVVVSCFVVLNLMDVGGRVVERAGATEGFEAIHCGDTYIRQALVSRKRPPTADKVSEALSCYQEAEKEPGALRRIIVAKEVFLRQPVDREINSLASRGAKYAPEALMWRSIYGSESIAPQVARGYVERVRQLAMGPLTDVAISSIYKRAGQTSEAKAAMDKARGDALVSATVGMLVMAAIVGAGLTGAVIGFMFLVRNFKELSNAPRASIQPTVLLISFIIYLIGYQMFSVVLSAVTSLLGLNGQTNADMAAQMLFDLVAMFGSLAASLVVLRNLIVRTGESASEIGLKSGVLATNIAWGVGGYCTALPLLGISTLVSRWLMEFVSRYVQTPEHPIVPVVSQGGWALLMSLIVAVIAAPIVEEITFRGIVYTAFRGRMGVWGAAALTSALFAALHPTFPGQFLPLFALAMVLSVVREKTGSLLPGMVCHALNNLVALILVVLTA